MLQSLSSQGIYIDDSCFLGHTKNGDDCSRRGYCVSVSADNLCFDLKAPSSSSV